MRTYLNMHTKKLCVIGLTDFANLKYTYAQMHIYADVVCLGSDSDIGLTDFADLRYTYAHMHIYADVVCLG
jgi:hypothetical protein